MKTPLRSGQDDNHECDSTHQKYHPELLTPGGHADSEMGKQARLDELANQKFPFAPGPPEKRRERWHQNQKPKKIFVFEAHGSEWPSGYDKSLSKSGRGLPHSKTFGSS